MQCGSTYNSSHLIEKHYYTHHSHPIWHLFFHFIFLPVITLLQIINRADLSFISSLSLSLRLTDSLSLSDSLSFFLLETHIPITSFTLTFHSITSLGKGLRGGVGWAGGGVMLGGAGWRVDFRIILPKY